MSERWSEQTVLQLVARVYDASVEAEAWPHFLEALAQAGRADLAAILPHDLETGTGRVFASTPLDPLHARKYEETYAPLNPWVRRGVQVMFPGSVRAGDAICSAAEIERSEFYQGYLRPLDLFHSMGACVAREGATISLCCLLRSRRARPFEAEDLLGLPVLAPHIRRALQIQTRLAGVEDLASAQGAALDCIAFGCVVLDRSGRVLSLNRAAREMAAEADGISLAGGRLCAARPADTARLRALASAAGLTLEGQGLDAGGALAVTRPSGRRPLHLLVLPFRGSLDPARKPRPAAIVFVTDPEECVSPGGDVLAGLFGLTAAEARIAAAVLEGHTPEIIAERLHLSPHTVRNQLKGIFSKTGTGRQAELVRLMLAGVAQMRGNAEAAGAAKVAPTLAAPAPARKRTTTRTTPAGDIA